MATKVETVNEHRKRYGATYMINIFGSIIPIILFLGYASTQMQSLATESEVAVLIQTHHMTGIHPLAQSAIDSIQGQLNNIILFQIEERIEKLIIVTCENPGLQSQLADAIRDLIQQHNGITGSNYRRPSCIELGVV